jgi:hypothetical protein
MKTFVPGIGFRRTGTRLVDPVSVTKGERTLTVLHLVATADATDLAYELTNVPTDQGTFPTPQRPGMDRVFLSDGRETYGVGGGMSISVRPGKLVRTLAMVPLPPGTTNIDLRVSGPSIGDWNVPLELVPFPAPGEGWYHDVNASDTRHGITVTVRGIVAMVKETAIDLSVLHEDAQVRVWGLGGLGMRDSTTALTLRDDKGHALREHFREDARDQLPDPSGIGDVAIFDAVAIDAGELTLEVPMVCFDDGRGSADIDLPVEAPIDVRLGEYPIRIQGSRVTTVTRGGRSMAALAIDLGPRDDDEICVIKPTSAKADGRMCGIGFGSHGIYAPAPKPLDAIEIYYEGDLPPTRVTLIGATVRARGPWRVSFAARPAVRDSAR